MRVSLMPLQSGQVSSKPMLLALKVVRMSREDAITRQLGSVTMFIGFVGDVQMPKGQSDWFHTEQFAGRR